MTDNGYGIFFDVGQVMIDTYSDELRNDAYQVIAFKLHNFKAFQETDWIRINQLTLFLGDNSAGKSVLYQVVKLLKTCFEAISQERYFNDLGGVKDIVGKYADAHNKNAADDKTRFSFLLENKKNTADKIAYHIEISPSKEHDYGRISDVVIESREWKRQLLEYYESQNLFFLRRKAEIEIPENISSDVKAVLEAMRNFAEQIRAISYQRQAPERSMTFTGSTKDYVDSDGANTYEMIVQLGKNDPEREKKINAWLRKFGYAYEWNAFEKNIGEFLLVNQKTGKKSNIVDNGLGISQSLPIAVELSDLKGTTILLDTPEAFLQTRMQSEMGDLLIEGAKTGNVLAETGSEYILLRIQRRIAEKVLNKEKVSFYFILDQNGDAKCYELQLNEYGEFINTPEKFQEFFSSDYYDMQAMSLEKINQKRKNEHAAGNRH